MGHITLRQVLRLSDHIGALVTYTVTLFNVVACICFPKVHTLCEIIMTTFWPGPDGSIVFYYMMHNMS